MVLILFLSVKATYLVLGVGQGTRSSPPGARQQRFEHRGPPGRVGFRAKVLPRAGGESYPRKVAELVPGGAVGQQRHEHRLGDAVSISTERKLKPLIWAPVEKLSGTSGPTKTATEVTKAAFLR